jgi:hypothetical protein
MEPTTLQAAAYIAGILVTAGATLVTVRYTRLKSKIKDIRAAVDAVDNALTDDKVTEEEFREIYAGFRNVLFS